MAVRPDLLLSCCSHGDTHSFQTNTLPTTFTPASRLLTLTPLSSPLLTYLHSCGLTGNDSGGCYSCRLASHLNTSPKSFPTLSSLVLRALSRPLWVYSQVLLTSARRGRQTSQTMVGKIRRKVHTNFFSLWKIRIGFPLESKGSTYTMPRAAVKNFFTTAAHHKSAQLVITQNTTFRFSHGHTVVMT